MATRTIQSLVTAARSLLHDSEEIRYTNTDILEGFNQALAIIRRNRPDVFINLYGEETYDYTTANLAQPFPLDQTLIPGVIGYMAGWCELREDQYTAEGRAAALWARFSTQLMGLGM